MKARPNSDERSNDDNASQNRKIERPDSRTPAAAAKPVGIERLFKIVLPWIAVYESDKSKELQELLDKYKIVLHCDDRSEEISCFASGKPNTITVGLHALERLWARAYGYTAVYNFITPILLTSPPRSMCVNLDDPSMAPAMELLQWSAIAEFDDQLLALGGSYWPVGLPRPNLNAESGSLEEVADNLMLCAVADILHRQIGHIILRHDIRSLPTFDHGSESTNQPAKERTDWILLDWEAEVDQWTGNWLMQGIEPNDSRFFKRLAGTILGFVWLDSGKRHGRGNIGKYSAPSCDRVYERIKRHLPDKPLAAIWLFFSYVLMLQSYSLSRRGVDSADAEDFEGWTRALLANLAGE